MTNSEQSPGITPTQRNWLVIALATLGAAAVGVGLGLLVALGAVAFIGLFSEAKVVFLVAAGLLALVLIGAGVRAASGSRPKPSVGLQVRTLGVWLAGIAAAVAGVLVFPATAEYRSCGYQVRHGAEAGVSGCDFSGEDLSGRELAGADLSGSDLSEADLSGANLSDSNLAGANLEGANLVDAQLAAADLSDASLSRGDLSRADLTDAQLANAELVATDLSEATLTTANFANATLANTRMPGADLSRAYLSGANLDAAELAHADLTGSDLTGSSLRGAELRQTSLVRAKGLSDADLAEALGVPSGEFARALRARMVVLEPRSSVVRAFGTACGGGRVSEAAAYAKGGFHPTVVLGPTGNPNEATRAAPSSWTPAAVRFGQLVACIGPERRKSVEQCGPYVAQGAAPGSRQYFITRYQFTRDARLVEARTGKVIARHSVSGDEPRACAQTETVGLSQITGSHVGAAAMQSWVAGFVD